jgi:hypothetical protein
MNIQNVYLFKVVLESQIWKKFENWYLEAVQLIFATQMQFCVQGGVETHDKIPK